MVQVGELHTWPALERLQPDWLRSQPLERTDNWLSSLPCVHGEFFDGHEAGFRCCVRQRAAGQRAAGSRGFPPGRRLVRRIREPRRRQRWRRRKRRRIILQEPF